VGQLLENGVGHIGEKRVGQLLEKSGFNVGHFPENSHKLKSCEPLSQEEFDRQQEIEALKAKFKQH